LHILGRTSNHLTVDVSTSNVSTKFNLSFYDLNIYFHCMDEPEI